MNTYVSLECVGSGDPGMPRRKERIECWQDRSRDGDPRLMGDPVGGSKTEQQLHESLRRQHNRQSLRCA